MNKKIFYLAVISCLLFAGQAEAQKFDFLKKHKRTVDRATLRSSSPMGNLPVFPLLSGTVVNSLAAQQVARPTTVYRELPFDYPEQSESLKYECEYDSYGHITSLKHYEWDGSKYVFTGSVESEYHRLPSGEFVKIKDGYELRHSEYSQTKGRHTSAYDNRGMLLWRQFESFNFDISTWQVGERTEARIENGVRTAILYNGVVVDSYTFDSKGRIIRYDYDSDYSNSTVSYTWNDNDRIVEAAESGTRDSDGDGFPDDTYAYTYRNIEIAHNEKYFNPYSLSPLDNDVNEYSWLSWGDFSVDDYTLHKVYYNLDATVVEDDMELQGQMRTIVNNSGNQIVQTTTIQVGGLETEAMTATIDVLDGYGSYRILEESGVDGRYEHLATYTMLGHKLSYHKVEN
jgi:hypothetical protein